jgi:hypothetical protein
MKHAIAILEVQLQTLETNEPIHLQEGNAEQADLCAITAAEVRQALAILTAADGGPIWPVLTTTLPTLQPHQQRVVDEKNELETRAHKLSQFIGHSPLFATLDPEEQERLKVQNDIMWQYFEVLSQRIAAFTA